MTMAWHQRKHGCLVVGLQSTPLSPWITHTERGDKRIRERRERGGRERGERLVSAVAQYSLSYGHHVRPPRCLGGGTVRYPLPQEHHQRPSHWPGDTLARYPVIKTFPTAASPGVVDTSCAAQMSATNKRASVLSPRQSGTYH